MVDKKKKKSSKFQRKKLNRIRENRISIIVRTNIRKLKREKRYARTN